MKNLFLFFSLFFCSVNVSFAASDEVEVVMFGVGATEEEAKQQAYRNAIQSVIGSMVISEVLVENDTLVRDKVLSHSDGYVTKATQVGAIRQFGEGLLEVTMRVTVKSQQLEQKLNSENITIAAVDGQSLFVRKKTQDEAKQDASAILVEKLKTLPASVLMATANIDESTQESKGSMVRLTIPVNLTVDKAIYGTFYKDFISTLDKLGFSSSSDTISHHGGMYQSRFLYGPSQFEKFLPRKLAGDEKYNAHILGVSNAVFYDTKTSRWKIYEISKEAYQAITDNPQSFKINIALVDKNGNTIAESNSSFYGKDDKVWKIKGLDTKKDIRAIYGLFSLKGQVQKKNNSFSLAVIAPEVLINFSPISNGSMDFISAVSNTITIDFPFDLTEEELKSITSIKSTILNIPVPKN